MNWRIKLLVLVAAGFLALPAAVSFAARANAQESGQSDHAAPSRAESLFDARIVEAFFHDDLLWVRGPSQLATVNLQAETSTIMFETGVIDVAVVGGDIWVLRTPARGRSFGRLSIVGAGHHSVQSTFDFVDGDQPLALVDIDGAPAVLTRKSIRILARQTGIWRKVELKGDLRSARYPGRGEMAALLQSGFDGNYGMPAVVSPPESGLVFAGFNIGKMGSGLHRIEIETGDVSIVESDIPAEPAGNIMEGNRFPVTGLIVDPQRSDCVVASFGRVDLFISTGRIIRVCGDDVSVVLERPAEAKISDQTFYAYEAFFTLEADVSGVIWAASWRAVYRIDGPDVNEFQGLKFENVAGLEISRTIPGTAGAVVILSMENANLMKTGATPLVIPVSDSR